MKLKMYKPILVFLVSITITEAIMMKSVPIVQTRLGRIQGTYKDSYMGRMFAAYEGVPYALPPIGIKRFEPPEPIGSWKDTLYAIKPSDTCTQYSHLPHYFTENPVSGDEDCLYLNVYVPVKAKSLPVIFAIHGGGYQFGSGSTGAKYFMDWDAILVTVNYRLGMFGFLSTEDSNVPGNMGLKDQSLALRWVSENIESFGGDPKRITLIGVSAGAASVHYHYLSPMSKGLFQNGISLSGTALGPGKHAENSREKAKKLAAILKCTTDPIPKMIECLKTRPADKMARATKNFLYFLYNPFTPFGPVVEAGSNKPFVNRSAVEIINSGDAADVLWITSVVSEEGLYPGADFINSDKLLDELNKNWEDIAPHLLDYNNTIPREKHVEVARKIRNYYFGDKPISKNTTDEMIALLSARLYLLDAEESARLQAKKNKSPVMFLKYSYRALTSLSDIFTFSKKNYGVSHSDDYFMLVANQYIKPPRKAEDRAMQVKLINYVVSVATKGSPDFNLTFEWKPVDPSQEKLHFLHVASPTNIQMSSDENLGQKKFWSTIHFDENKLP